MTKARVNRRPLATSSRPLIGKLIEHPVRGVGLVTGHIIYPGGTSHSVYGVIWAGSSRVDNVDRRVIDACLVVGPGVP